MIHRIWSAIVGLVFGAVLGMLALYLIMLIADTNFGLDNVRPGALLGGVVGLVLGLRSSKRWSWLDFIDADPGTGL